jgi:hypothetical protein
MRIFLDANILFSAAKSDGAVRSLVTLLLATQRECWVDGYVARQEGLPPRCRRRHRSPRIDACFPGH